MFLKKLWNRLFGKAEKAPLSVAEVAGAQAENAVASAIGLACKTDNRSFRILQNVYVPIDDHFTEIDTLLVHASGLYVFESKNVFGKLYGDLDSPKWTCYTSQNDKQTFCNPIKQNARHIQWLGKFLRLQSSPLKTFSIIVLGKNMTVKRIPPNSEQFTIYDIQALRQKFHLFIGRQPSVYTKPQVEQIYSKLKLQTNVSAKTKQEHINRLQKNKAQ